MKKHLALTLFVAIAATGQGQQAWQLSQYQSNAYLFNPAAAGEHDYLELNLSYRQQWLNTEFSPTTYYVSATSRVFNGRTVRPNTLPTSNDIAAPTKSKIIHGVGGLLLRDGFGAFTQSLAAVSYAVHVPISRSWHLAAALKGGMKLWAFDPARVTLGQANDPGLSTFIAQNQVLNTWLPMVDVGIYAYHRMLFVSYSTDQLTEGTMKLETLGSPKVQRTHYAMLGTNLILNQSTRLVPSTLVKYTADAPISIDVNLKLDVQDRYFLAVGYRLNSDLIFTGALFLNDMLKVGYSYDLSTTEVQSVGGGSHEIFLGLELFKSR